MKLTDPTGAKWTVTRQVGAWRRRTRAMWALEVLPGGLGDDVISLIIAIPFLALAAILLACALIELAAMLIALPVVLLLRALNIVGSKVVVVNTAKPIGVWPKSGKIRLRYDQFSITVLEVESAAASVRLRDAIAEHLRRGGDVMDHIVGQWLAVERGRLASRVVKPDPVPPALKAEPA